MSRPARPRPARRLSRGSRAPRPRGRGGPAEPREVRRAPLAREVSAAPADPRRHRRPHSVDARGHDRPPVRRPSLAALAARWYRRATSVFPSLTPVCLSSIATGAHGDVHEIPHLVWYRPPRGAGRGVRQLVRCGPCRRNRQDAAGHPRNMNGEHLGRGGDVFESLADAGFDGGRQLHRLSGSHAPPSAVPFLARLTGRGDSSSTTSSAPIARGRRSPGGIARRSIDAYASAVGRWLVTRDAFDFLLFYFSDYDYASHARGPTRRSPVLRRCDAAIGALAEAGRRGRGLSSSATPSSSCPITARRLCARPPRSARRRRPRRRASPGSNRAAHVYLQPGSRLEHARLRPASTRCPR